MLILTQFLLRLSFGMALAMALTPPRLVTSGYYRNNLYALLGLNVVPALAAWTAPGGPRLAVWPPLAAALLSYVGAVIWLYEKPLPGRLVMVAISVVTLWGAWLVDSPPRAISARGMLDWLDPIAGGLVLGITMAAMLLGHWYLNAPGMSLAPLARLVVWLGAALALRAALCGLGLAWEASSGGIADLSRWLFVGLRWLFGLVGAAVVAGMTWQTLKIPNTQSATGLLYVAVIATFLGELMSLLLSAESDYPL